jgi:hypothetical protein
MVRKDFVADWVFGIRGAIEKIVREHFPKYTRQWPIIQGFVFEAFMVENDFFVIIMKDNLNRIPSGPGVLKPFPYQDYPPVPTMVNQMIPWLDYLVSKFLLNEEDIGIILPLHDCGENSAQKDFSLFKNVEKEMWQIQLNFYVERQKRTIPFLSEEPTKSPTINYNFSINSDNSKVNIDSNDYSITNITQTPEYVFDKLIQLIRQSKEETEVKEKFLSSIDDMRSNVGKTSFKDSYLKFMSILADHIQVLGPLISPFLPALFNMIT